MRTGPAGKSSRNIGITAHIDAGKTTLSERILFYTGVSERMGEVHEGTAIMDWMEEEQRRGISITAACTTCSWRGVRLNLIDTPGHVDFTVEVERSLRVLDGAITVFCAVGGVEAQAETVWRQADRYRVPRIAFVNKLDRVGADYGRTLREMREVLGANPLPVEIPLGEGDDFQGVIDLPSRKAILWDEESLGVRYEIREIAPQWRDRAEGARRELIDALAEIDERIVEEFVEAGDVAAKTVEEALRRATLELRGTPVYCGAALRNAGIQPLLDAVVGCLPGPEDLPPALGRRPGSGEAKVVSTDPDAPFAALVFKVAADSAEGTLSYLRVYAGRAKTGDTLWNPTLRRNVTLGRLVRMHAGESHPVDAIEAGEIAAIVGEAELATGDTLCDESDPVVLEAMTVPLPVVAVAVEPRAEEDRELLEEGLRRLVAQDPSLRLKSDPATGQMVVSGMGELHLEVVMERLGKMSRLDPRVGRPTVEEREMVLQAAEGEGRFEKGPLLATVRLRVEPEPERPGWIVEEAWRRAGIDEGLRATARAGVEEALERGAVGGHPMTGLRALLLDADFSGPPEAQGVVKLAAESATREAARKGGVVLAAPEMELEVLGPENTLGDILTDLNARRAKIEGLEERGGSRVVRATAPLSALFGYAGDLRSKTKGRATFCMQFRRYAPKR